MVSNLYETVLAEIGAILGVSLFPDSHNTCLVKLKSGVRVQMEMDPKGHQFVLGIDLGVAPPPGQYRQNLFREALRANGKRHPRHGILAYSRKTNHMVLYDTLDIQDLNGERVAFHLTPLAEKGRIWQEAIQRGEVPLVESSSPTKGNMARPPAHLFGLRP